MLVILLTVTVDVIAQNPYVEGSHRSKLSPWLQQRCSQQMRRADDQTLSCMMVLVESTDGEASIRRAGGVPLGYADPAWIVLIPVNRLYALSAEPAISRIEADEMPKPLLDESLQMLNVTDVWSGMKDGSPSLPQAYTGKGVVAALIDQGTLFQHPMLRDADGNSRITWFWDITKESADEHVGVVYDTPQEVLAASPSRMASYIPHGTHVAGIMAGTLFGGRQGIAYEAEIMGAEVPDDVDDAVKEKISNWLTKIFPELANLGVRARLEDSDIMIVAALKSIYEQADAKGEPCVVNLSYGARDLWRRTRSLAEQAIENMLKVPGHIFVAAAGNDGASEVYREKKAGEKMNTNLGGLANRLYVNWKKSEGAPTLNVSLGSERLTIDFKQLIDSLSAWDATKEPDKDVAYSDSLYRYTITYMPFYPLESDNITAYLDILLEKEDDETTYQVASDYTGVLSLVNVKEAFSEVEPALSKGQNIGTIAAPACFESVIAVGAMHHRSSVKNLAGQYINQVKMGSQPGTLATISSCGPTLDGRIKPDVVAPGADIISAVPVLTDPEMSPLMVYMENKFGVDYALATFTGTSMAAPHVSGIIALWLQANPKLTQNDVKEIIRKTSHQREAQYTEKNNFYGWGEIDAYAGLLEALSLSTSVKELSTSQPSQATFRVEGRALSILMAESASGRLSVYDVKGVLQATYPVNGTTRIDLSKLPAGVYAVQLTTNDRLTTGSTLIRL